MKQGGNCKLAMASDFDGTIFFMRREEKMNPEDISAVKAFQEAGNLFGICSGRSLRGITDALLGALTMDFYILVNGALIADKDKNVLYKKCVPLSFVRGLYERYEGNGVYAVIQANDTVYSFYDEIQLQERIYSFDALKDADVYGISFGTDSTQTASRMTEEINREYGDICQAYTNVFNVDVVPKGCSKGKALRFLKERLGIDRIAGIGDSFNDIPLLENADRGYTFPHAPEEARLAAAAIVDNAAQAISDFMLSSGRTEGLYASIRERSEKAFMNGGIVDDWLVKRAEAGKAADTRMAVICGIRPDAGLKTAVARKIKELGELGDGLYLYPESDLHFTVLDILKGMEGRKIPEKELLDRYLACLKEAASAAEPFSITLTGLTFSDSVIMAKGEYDPGLEELRQNLRKILRREGLELSERYETKACHISVARFMKKMEDPERVLSYIKDNLQDTIGSMKVDRIELCFHDWYDDKKENLGTFTLSSQFSENYLL